MTRHTPGPWRVEPDLSNIGVGGVTMSNGNRIGTADDYEWGHLQIADARLIAAAPELLAACLMAETVLGGALSTPARAETLQMLRFALAKAEGR